METILHSAQGPAFAPIGETKADAAPGDTAPPAAMFAQFFAPSEAETTAIPAEPTLIEANVEEAESGIELGDDLDLETDAMLGESVAGETSPKPRGDTAPAPPKDTKDSSAPITSPPQNTGESGDATPSFIATETAPGRQIEPNATRTDDVLVSSSTIPPEPSRRTHIPPEPDRRGKPTSVSMIGLAPPPNVPPKNDQALEPPPSQRFESSNESTKPLAVGPQVLPAASPMQHGPQPTLDNLDDTSDLKTELPPPPVSHDRWVVPRAPHMPQTAQSPQAIAQQVVATLSAHPQGETELSLAPEELGKLRMRMSPAENGVIGIIITAERPDTSDLIRRNLQQFETALAEFGLGEVQVSLSQHSQDQAFTGAQQIDDAPIIAEYDPPPMVHLTTHTALDRLDIRL